MPPVGLFLCKIAGWLVITVFMIWALFANKWSYYLIVKDFFCSYWHSKNHTNLRAVPSFLPSSIYETLVLTGGQSAKPFSCLAINLSTLLTAIFSIFSCAGCVVVCLFGNCRRKFHTSTKLCQASTTPLMGRQHRPPVYCMGPTAFATKPLTYL